MSLTPWDVDKELDYDKLIKKFGTEPLKENLFKKLKKPMPPPIRRGMCFSHRNLDKWLDDYEKGKKVSIVSGRGPSEKMHIGHLTLYSIPKYFQDVYGCKVYIPISDDEKFFVKDNLRFEEVEKYALDNILDILAMGYDPKKTIVHRDFEYTNIYKYAARIAKKMTYSTAKAVFGLKPDTNIGWTFYPAMQAAHILFPQFHEGEKQRTLVPIGIDQDPFMRVTRDVAEKFGFIKPGAIHKILAPGLKSPKMSSSKGEAIWLSDDEKTVRKKIMKYAFSGGQPSVEKHRKLGGNPNVDVSFLYLKYFFEESDKKLKEIEENYRNGSLLTGELKEYLIKKINSYLKEHKKRKEKVKKNLDKFILR